LDTGSSDSKRVFPGLDRTVARPVSELGGFMYTAFGSCLRRRRLAPHPVAFGDRQTRGGVSYRDQSFSFENLPFTKMKRKLLVAFLVLLGGLQKNQDATNIFPGPDYTMPGGPVPEQAHTGPEGLNTLPE